MPERLIPPVGLLEAGEKSDALVLIRDLIGHEEFRTGLELPLGIGLDRQGLPVIPDLAKLHHLVVVGAGGSGKSVLLHDLILSLIYKAPCEDLRLILLDTRLLEFGAYESLPHLLFPVLTTKSYGRGLLLWLHKEVERRSVLLAASHCRSVQEFNRRDDVRTSVAGPLPRLVVVIDDIADIFIEDESSEEQEGGDLATLLGSILLRLGPSGVYMILATQAPGTDGLAVVFHEALPNRIVFRLASSDIGGVLGEYSDRAAQLTHLGRCLFLGPAARGVLLQAPFVSTEVIDRVTAWYPEHVSSAPLRLDPGILVPPVRPRLADDADPLFLRAAEVCIENQLGSTALLQRRMGIGYGRAAQIVDQLEAAGILGPAWGSKPRDVLVGLEQLHAIYDKSRAGHQARATLNWRGSPGCLGMMLLSVALFVCCRK